MIEETIINMDEATGRVVKKKFTTGDLLLCQIFGLNRETDAPKSLEEAIVVGLGMYGDQDPISWLLDCVLRVNIFGDGCSHHEWALHGSPNSFTVKSVEELCIFYLGVYLSEEEDSVDGRSGKARALIKAFTKTFGGIPSDSKRCADCIRMVSKIVDLESILSKDIEDMLHYLDEQNTDSIFCSSRLLPILRVLRTLLGVPAVVEQLLASSSINWRSPSLPHRSIASFLSNALFIQRL